MNLMNLILVLVILSIVCCITIAIAVVLWMYPILLIPTLIIFLLTTYKHIDNE